MMSRFMIITLVLVSVMLISTFQVPASEIPVNSKSDKELCPDQVETKGFYENWDFGFKVKIPPNLSGSWNSANCVNDPDEGCVCMPDHGRVIPLLNSSPDSGGYIELYAGFDGASVEEAVKDRLKRMRKQFHNKNVKVLKTYIFRLAGLNAQRVVVRYQPENENQWVIEDFVQAKRKSIEYSLYLRTKEEAYKKDRYVFEAILKSFKLTKAGQL